MSREIAILLTLLAYNMWGREFVTNPGSQNLRRNIFQNVDSVVVYDELDPNVTFVSASDGGFVNTDTGDTIPDGAIQWNVGALAPGDTVVYTLTVTVNSDAPTQTPNGEDLVNTVTVTTISDDTNLENNVDTEPTDVNFPAAPELTLVKTASPSMVPK